MRWVDQRLTWDPADFGGVTSIVTEASNAEVRRIWTPDIKILNAQEATESMFEETSAEVFHDGTVFWSRCANITNTRTRSRNEAPIAAHLTVASPYLTPVRFLLSLPCLLYTSPSPRDS